MFLLKGILSLYYLSLGHDVFHLLLFSLMLITILQEIQAIEIKMIAGEQSTKNLLMMKYRESRICKDKL